MKWGTFEWTYIAGLFSAGDVGQFWPDRIIFFSGNHCKRTAGVCVCEWEGEEGRE